MPLYSFADLVQPALQIFREQIAAALASLDLPTDRAHITTICRAIAILAHDPQGIALASLPAAYETYARAADAIRVFEQNFPELVLAFQGFATELAHDPQLQRCIQDAIDASEIPPGDVYAVTHAEICRLLMDVDVGDTP
jgi:hypothetical protein